MVLVVGVVVAAWCVGWVLVKELWKKEMMMLRLLLVSRSASLLAAAPRGAPGGGTSATAAGCLCEGGRKGCGERGGGHETSGRQEEMQTFALRQQRERRACLLGRVQVFACLPWPTKVHHRMYDKGKACVSVLCAGKGKS